MPRDFGLYRVWGGGGEGGPSKKHNLHQGWGKIKRTIKRHLIKIKKKMKHKIKRKYKYK